jgi:hydroxymethylpyrimidine/phosphomethylpyrimidine kinase
LCAPGGSATALRHPAVATTADHGTGCTYASALAARVAHGDALEDAARTAAAYVSDRLAASSHWRLGRGRGPVSHLSPAPSPTRKEQPA